MDELISRQAAIDAIQTINPEGDSLINSVLGIIELKIMDLPSVQPEETIEEQERGIDEALRVARDIATIIQNEKDMRVIRKRGRWTTPTPKDCMTYARDIVECSCCHAVTYQGLKMNYCPNCGSYNGEKS